MFPQERDHSVPFPLSVGEAQKVRILHHGDVTMPGPQLIIIAALCCEIAADAADESPPAITEGERGE